MLTPFKANSALSGEDLLAYETMTVVGSTAVMSCTGPQLFIRLYSSGPLLKPRGRLVTETKLVRPAILLSIILLDRWISREALQGVSRVMVCGYVFVPFGQSYSI